MASIEDHAVLIDGLGGPTQVSTEIRRATGQHVSPDAVSQWRNRKIAWRYRHIIIEIARANNVPVPLGLLAS